MQVNKMNGVRYLMNNEGSPQPFFLPELISCVNKRDAGLGTLRRCKVAISRQPRCQGCCRSLPLATSRHSLGKTQVRGQEGGKKDLTGNDGRCSTLFPPAEPRLLQHSPTAAASPGLYNSAEMPVQATSLCAFPLSPCFSPSRRFRQFVLPSHRCGSFPGSRRC